MPTNLQSRTQYLALAEFCQIIIERLMDFVDGANGTDAALKPTLREALRSLEAISAGRVHALARTSPTPLGTFEQIRTLQEVWDDTQLRRAVRLIKGLLAPTSSRAKKLQIAGDLIELFSKLQTKALWNFSQPTKALPRSFRELCRAL